LHWACRYETESWVFWTLLASQAIVVYFLSLLAMIFATLRGRRRYLKGVLGEQYEGQFPPAAYEFRSRATLLGLPLLHIRLGDRFDVVRGPVKAWIAIGSSHAMGVIFASGGLAIAPISFGGIAIGLVSFGAIAIGILPLGAISLGVWAYGGLALGWEAFCGIGMAWNAATGGAVAAHGFASGSVALAPEANTPMVDELFRQNLFFRVAQAISNHGLLVTLLWVVPVGLQARVVGLARRRREMAGA
ncbi:MAG TPA: hypothetical protein VKV04_25100, partial [Verrucomicrobiae bacterium]|nr:hypothetical protein [Verrucomicrobiae bacterium]